MRRRQFGLALAVILGLLGTRVAGAADFAAVQDRARGQTVYFNAWAGSEPINAYLAWVAATVRERFGIDLVHVKLAATTDAVQRIVADAAAGKRTDGGIDLIWINGANFGSLKAASLLYGPFAPDLPNASLVDVTGKPTTQVDFGIPTEGFESPWGMAQFVLLYDTKDVPEPPRTIAALGDWIRAHPGRFAYPAPPDFIGTTFLKHVLLETAPDTAPFYAPAGADAGKQLEPLWAWLDGVAPALWRGGKTFPASGPALHQLLDDGEVDFSLAFNPAEASSLIAAGTLPDTVRTFILEQGTIANTHFVAIPFNAAHKDAAMVVADFLLSPEAQAKKQDPAGWGDANVLDLARLDPADDALFTALPLGVATLPEAALKPVRLEPHPSWVALIEDGWRQRYAR